MLELLAANPILLLFVVAAAGDLLGQVKVRGVGLGVSAVLFVGLALNAADSRLVLPELVPQLGLVLFVYSIGLSSGPTFFTAFRARGLQDAALTAVSLGAAAGVVLVGARLLSLGAGQSAGVFCGALTNTSALAAVVGFLRNGAGGGVDLAAPVVGYSLAYPFGVLGVLLAISFARWLSPARPGSDEALEGRAVLVTSEELLGNTLHTLKQVRGWNVVFSQVRRQGVHHIVTHATELQAGDVLTMVGTRAAVRQVAAELGRLLEELPFDRAVDYRRFFVSNPQVVGRSLGSLELAERFGAQVTRVRRGDVDLLGREELVLELGDRVRVVAPREAMHQLSGFFGDSYRALAEVDVLSVGAGITLGALLGLVSVPVTEHLTVSLGLAGGPLVSGLVLGRLGRTGRLVWAMPFSANLTLRQLGLVLFFAGVGTRSGSTFAATLFTAGALQLLAVGALATVASGFSAAFLGLRTLKLPLPVVAGMVAGIHTQPAALAFACQSTGSDQPNHGYSAVFPVATLAKILLAQVLAAALR